MRTLVRERFEIEEKLMVGYKPSEGAVGKDLWERSHYLALT